MKRLLAFVSSLLVIGGLLSASPVPAHATGCGNTQAQTFATVPYGDEIDSVHAQMSLNTAHLPGESNWQINSHWISVQDNTTKYLVQGGWNINEQEATYYYGFFYEFVGPGGTGVRPITLDSSNWHPGDQFYFSLWYHSTDSWGFQIKDVSTNTILWSHYIYPNGGYAAAYIGHTANVATENNCFYDLFDDGVITIKQPSLHVMGGAWYLFENVVQVGGFQNKADLVVAGHTLETGSLTDANGYAYHTWKNFY